MSKGNTMTRLQQLRETRNAISAEANTINSKVPAGQPLSSDDGKRLDSLLDQIAAIDEDISRQNRLAQHAIDTDPNALHAAAMNAATKTPGAHGDPTESAALRAYLRGGLGALSPEQRALVASRPGVDIQAAMSTTTGSEGGFTTAQEYQRSLEQAMKQYGGLLPLVTTIPMASGVTMSFPTTDATSEEGEIVGQNAPSGSQDTTFGLATIDVYMFGSKSIAIPFQLLQDSMFDVDAYVQGLISMRIGRRFNRAIATGTGTGEPFGIVPRAVVGKAAANGQTTSMTYDDFVDLEHSVDPIYRAAPGAGYAMHDLSLRAVRKIKDAQNRPIFSPGYEADAMINGGAPDRLMGRPIYIVQEMPVMAANAKSILFGDYKKYVVRSVMDTTIFRMTDSAFTLKGQVGFVAFKRGGGNLIDAGGAVKAYQNSAT
jgi:HK97 family phage major capsid protein